MRGHPEQVATQLEALRHNKHKHKWAIAGRMQSSGQDTTYTETHNQLN
jgi:hypothetical protein